MEDMLWQKYAAMLAEKLDNCIAKGSGNHEVVVYLGGAFAVVSVTLREYGRAAAPLLLDYPAPARIVPERELVWRFDGEIMAAYLRWPETPHPPNPDHCSFYDATSLVASVTLMAQVVEDQQVRLN